MRKTKETVAVKPQSKRIPNFSGVSGELIPADPALLLVFGNRCRISPYDGLLDQLAEKTNGGGAGGFLLRFGDTRARAAVQVRARKKGLRISFAESGGSLFVRLDGSASKDLHETRREAIKHILRTQPMTAMRLAAKMRDSGDPAATGPLVESILLQMLKAAEVVRQEGDTWALNPRAGRG